MGIVEPYGEKKTALVAAGKVGHKIALIGQRVFGNLLKEDVSREDAEIQLFNLPGDYDKIEPLSNYTLVILDYESFRDSQQFQQYFAKRMVEALELGVNFCFVHYDHPVPGQGSFSLDNSNTYGLYSQQIGLQAIWGKGIVPYRATAAFHSGKVIRNEFKRFLDTWGGSHNFFSAQDGFDDVIYQAVHENNLVLGFALASARGKIILLPFIRDFSRKDNAALGIKTLIDCLLTYIVKSLTQLPSWAERPFFSDERALAQQRDSLRVSLAEVDAKLSTFEHAKSMLFQHEYSLESSVPRFLKNNLCLNVEREETYKEDFWVLGEENKKVAIAEVKSLVKGFRRGAIYSVLHHRDEYGLDETFPALLVANCNLQAGSFEDKDRVIDINDCQFAAENNVLIISNRGFGSTVGSDASQENNSGGDFAANGKR